MIENDLLHGMAEWSAGERNQAVRIAERLSLLADPGERHWSSGPLRPYMPALVRDIEAGATSEEAPVYRRQAVERWLRMLDVGDEAAELAERLAGQAYDTLMRDKPDRTTEAGRRALDASLTILATLRPDPRRDGMAEEAEGRLERAVDCYRKAGAKRELLQLVRNHALWEVGVEELTGRDLDAVKWLLDVEKTIAAAPEGIAQHLTQSDWERVQRNVLALATLNQNAEA